MRRTTLVLAVVTTTLLACGNGASSDPIEAGAGASKGEQLYRMQCVLCHGADGKLGFNGAKDLTASALSRAEMIARVSEGKGVMQPYKNMLAPKEIEAVVDYVRKLPKAK